MVGILHRATKLAQREPAHAAVVKLHKFSIGFAALLFAEDEAVSFMQGLSQQIIEVGLGSSGAGTIRTALGLELQDPQIDPHLQDFAAVPCPNQPSDNVTRLELPGFQYVVDVLTLAHL